MSRPPRFRAPLAHSRPAIAGAVRHITVALAAVTTLAVARPAAAQTLRGSRDAVDRAYSFAKRRGLSFNHSRTEIETRAREGDYVRLGNTRSLRLKGVAVPYVRPATRAFVNALAVDYARTCGEPLTVTSAMRPTTMHLPNGVQKSVHPTGMALDLRIPRGRCQTWLRRQLLDFERDGLVDATEERHPRHFHVIVFRAP